ncbi:MAG TPA: hypothetical protein VMJ32_19010 [Pirellulales bacterium]|nr:hypothetical protein [Pirellulales bacterium]
MKYTVIWRPSAEQALTSIWLAARDRSAVTSASSGIEIALQLNPNNVGESRSSGRRIMFIYPLAVIFRVIKKDMQVRVLKVWRFG